MFNLETVTYNTLMIALVLTVLMIASRWISYKIIWFYDTRFNDHVLLVSLMVSRGLTAGITAFMPVEQGLQVPPITDIVIVMILFTNIVATIGFIVKTRK